MHTPLDPAIITHRFVAAFGTSPRLFQAPGRLNIIGEHVDYCGGPVLPAAIDRRIVLAVAGNDRTVIRARTPFGDADLPLDGFHRHHDWRDHVVGMAYALRDAGYAVGGADLVIDSDVPSGAGVSSSAALGVGVGLALCAAAGIAPPDGQTLARIAQASENIYVGMPCGIMDQFASANGVAGHALALNCDTLACTPVPVPADARFILIDSAVKHTHTESAYASRRADCEAAAAALGVSLLVEVDDWATAAPHLSGNPLKRARHVVSEIARVATAQTALAAGDLAALGALMSQSHASLSADMEVSTPEVDQLARLAQSTPGILGARMMGGGFGGSVIALARAADAVSAMHGVASAYGAARGITVSAFVAGIAGGAGELS
jgi:galactokinase